MGSLLQQFFAFNVFCGMECETGDPALARISLLFEARTGNH